LNSGNALETFPVFAQEIKEVCSIGKYEIWQFYIPGTLVHLKFLDLVFICFFLLATSYLIDNFVAEF
jgi:hypothetical protein